MQEMLTIGSLDICVSGILNTYEPLFTLFEMPYLYTSREHVVKVNNSSIMKDVAASLEKNGIVLIGFYENGFRNISTSNTPVNRPEDLTGLKIRTPENPAQIQTIKILGGIPTPLSFSELYTALIQGVVDGQENPLQNIWSGRLYESQKFIAKTHHIYNSAYVTASKRMWDKLDEGDRQLIKSCMDESSEWQLNYMRKLDIELEEKMIEKGVTFTYPDQKAFARATEPAYEIMYQMFGDRARRIVEAIRAMK
jgi:tripartite ATP-independent transporter DctP family solute receptor